MNYGSGEVILPYNIEGHTNKMEEDLRAYTLCGTHTQDFRALAPHDLYLVTGYNHGPWVAWLSGSKVMVEVGRGW